VKTLVLIGAGVESVAIIRRAKAMGLRTVVVDGNPQAPGFAAADVRVVQSTYDADGVVEALQDVGPLDGVLCAATDTPVTAASVAAAFSLPGLPVSVAALGADKIKMKRWLIAAGIPTARGARVDSVESLEFVWMNMRGDAVVKPADSRGARGVLRLSAEVDTEWAFKTAAAESPSGQVLVEEWLEGPQQSTEALLLSDGTSLSLMLDRNYSRLAEFAPFIIEDGADGPTRLPPEQADQVQGLFVRAARSVVGRHPCTVKGDMVLTPEGPKVIELALRLSGGYSCTEMFPRMTGIDFVGAAIRLALGEDVKPEEVQPTRHRGVAIRYVIPPGCKSHPERGGHVIADGASREEAIGLAEAMVALGEVEP